MIRHVLFIQFKATAAAAAIDAVRLAFLSMPQQVEGVEAVEWGENDSPEGKNRSFSHCVLMTFKDETARQHYLPHPAHEALKAEFLPVLEDIIVLDYHCQRA